MPIFNIAWELELPQLGTFSLYAINNTEAEVMLFLHPCIPLFF
jgi:hypothetical protein